MVDQSDKRLALFARQAENLAATIARYADDVKQAQRDQWEPGDGSVYDDLLVLGRAANELADRMSALRDRARLAP